MEQTREEKQSHQLMPMALTVSISCIAVILLASGLSSENEPFADALRYIGMGLCWLLAIFSYTSAHETNDSLALIIAMTITMAADTLLLLPAFQFAGVCVFCFAHLVYIYRYAPKAAWVFLTITASVFAVLFTAWLFGRQLPALLIVCGLYALLILANTVCVFATQKGSIRTLLLKLGMIAFIICDINVVLYNIVTDTGSLHHLIGVAVWLFYLPAQLMLALSGYRIE